MARIFITGSSDGIGNHLAKSLIAQGHTVILHARSSQRAQEALSRTPGASSILIGDLSSISQTKALAAEANKLGTFDAVIHNAGVGYREGRKMTEDGIAQVFAVNALAPYVLTSLMSRPGRVVYMSSGLHRGGDGALGDVGWREKRWHGLKAYSDSKELKDVGTGKYYAANEGNGVHPAARNEGVQEGFLGACKDISGVKFPKTL